MAQLAYYTFDGYSSGDNLSTSHTDSGTALGQVVLTGSSTAKAQAAAAVNGRNGGEFIAAGSGSVVNGFWSLGNETLIGVTWYMTHQSAVPSSGAVVLDMTTSGAARNMEVQIRGSAQSNTDKIALRDSIFTARHFSTTSVVVGTTYLLALLVNASTTNGWFECRLFTDLEADVLNDTPTETFGNQSSNWNTLASIDRVRFGAFNTAGHTVRGDGFVVGDTYQNRLNYDLYKTSPIADTIDSGTGLLIDLGMVRDG